jgi:hypothetical protein
MHPEAVFDAVRKGRRKADLLKLSSAELDSLLDRKGLEAVI